MANNYDINYEDSRFQQVETDKKAALNEIDQTYGSMIGQAEKFYDDQIKANQEWADKQAQLQNERTDFEIQKIEQQKEQTRKDYLKEQSGAYVDWQKQSNQYGANAEQMAASGLKNTGYSESSQVAMYNTYQNRVATARASLEQANTNYDNAMTEARLQNNSILAELAYNTYKQQLELALQGFQYQNQLILEQSNRKTEADNNYYGRYLNVLNQINTENAMAEEVRQYNEKMDEEKRQYNESLALQQAQLDEEKRQFNEQMAAKKASSSGGSNSSGGSVGGGEDLKIEVPQEGYIEVPQNGGTPTGANGTVRSYNQTATLNGGVVKDGPTATATLKDDGDAGGNLTITNRHGDSWIEIPGHGRYSYAEVYAYVKDGTIKETISNGKATYKWVGKKGAGTSGNSKPTATGNTGKLKDLKQIAW